MIFPLTERDFKAMIFFIKGVWGTLMFEKIFINLASKVLQKYKNKYAEKEKVKLPVRDEKPIPRKKK